MSALAATKSSAARSASVSGSTSSSVSGKLMPFSVSNGCPPGGVRVTSTTSPSGSTASTRPRISPSLIETVAPSRTWWNTPGMVQLASKA